MTDSTKTYSEKKVRERERASYVAGVKSFLGWHEAEVEAARLYPDPPPTPRVVVATDGCAWRLTHLGLQFRAKYSALWCLSAWKVEDMIAIASLKANPYETEA